MKRFSMVFTVLVALALIVLLSGTAAAEAEYVGVGGCKICHKKDKTGNQYGQWESSKHANAYNTLASDKAKEVASAKGIANAQEAPECLKCHVTGHDADASLLGKKYKVEDGVGCESCHGAGGDYKKKKVMEVRDDAVAKGLVVPTADTCTACHNADSPTFESFDYDARNAEIAHPNPEK